MTIADVFWENVCTCGDEPAFVLPGDAFHPVRSWRDVGQVVIRWIAVLRNARLSAGERVVTWLPNSLDWIAIDLACQSLGIVHVAIDRREPESRMRAIARQCDAALILDRPFPHTVDLPELGFDSREWIGLSRQVDSAAAAQILCTSGTSGRVKLVMLSHDNLLGNARAKLAAAPQFATDLRLNILPFTHAYARTCELSTWILSRSRLAIADSWEHWIALAEQLRPTLANFVPYLAQRACELLHRRSPALEGLRLLQVGGAGLAEDVWQTLARHGLPPLQGYGLTEASPVICSNRSGSQRCGTVGPAVSGVQLRVDSEGLLWTKSRYVMLGYWQDSLATDEVVQDGWLNTGDFAEIQTHGLRIIGRKSQQIVLSTGYKVCPIEVETRMLKHPWLAQVVVFGDAGPYLQCALWPQLDAVPQDFFDGNARTIESLDKPRWAKSVLEACRTLLDDLPRHAIPRAPRILKEPLSVASGTLTLKGAARRECMDSLEYYEITDAR